MTTLFYMLRNNIRDAYWNIRYAIQRVYKGYDNRMVFGFCDYFPLMMAKILSDFKKNNIGMWEQFDDNDKHIRELSEYEQELILNEMIQCFTYSSEITLTETRYPEIYSEDKYYIEHQKECFQKMHECELDAYKYSKRGMQLLTKYFPQMWY